MSPEQSEGKPLDPRTDVFSLGVVLYEMLCLQRPFRGDTRISTLAAILRETPETPRHANVRSRGQQTHLGHRVFGRV